MLLGGGWSVTPFASPERAVLRRKKFARRDANVALSAHVPALLTVLPAAETDVEAAERAAATRIVGLSKLARTVEQHARAF